MADLPKSNKKHRKSIFKRIHAIILPQHKSKLKKIDNRNAVGHLNQLRVL